MRALAVAIAVVVIVFVAAELALPPLAENRVEDRLTEGGGDAEVTIDAFPAARLLLEDGDELSVTGSGLELDVDEQDPDALEKLDGFDRVSIDLDDFRAGPFEVDGFELARDGSRPYTLVSSASTTAADLTGYGAERLGIVAAPLLEFFASRVREANRPIPIELDLEMESDQGRVLVTSGGGTVAGYPTGPLAELITTAIVIRL